MVRLRAEYKSASFGERAEMLKVRHSLMVVQSRRLDLGRRLTSIRTTRSRRRN
jgi:hypothetical protein